MKSWLLLGGGAVIVGAVAVAFWVGDEPASGPVAPQADRQESIGDVPAVSQEDEQQTGSSAQQNADLAPQSGDEPGGGQSVDDGASSAAADASPQGVTPEESEAPATSETAGLDAEGSASTENQPEGEPTAEGSANADTSLSETIEAEPSGSPAESDEEVNTADSEVSPGDAAESISSLAPAEDNADGDGEGTPTASAVADEPDRDAAVEHLTQTDETPTDLPQTDQTEVEGELEIVILEAETPVEPPGPSTPSTSEVESEPLASGSETTTASPPNSATSDPVDSGGDTADQPAAGSAEREVPPGAAPGTESEPESEPVVNETDAAQEPSTEPALETADAEVEASGPTEPTSTAVNPEASTEHPSVAADADPDSVDSDEVSETNVDQPATDAEAVSGQTAEGAPAANVPSAELTETPSETSSETPRAPEDTEPSEATESGDLDVEDADELSVAALDVAPLSPPIPPHSPATVPESAETDVTGPTTGLESAESETVAPEVVDRTEGSLVAPSFDAVRVNERGMMIIAGRAAPGAMIVITDNGEVIGSVEADVLGEFVFIGTTRLSPGDHEIGLAEITETDAQTGILSDQVVLLIVPEQDLTVANTQPTEGAAGADETGALAVLVDRDEVGPTEVLQAPAPPASIADGSTPPPASAGDQDVAASDRPSAVDNVPASEPQSHSAQPAVSIDVVDYDDQGRLIVAGRAAVGAVILIYLDNRPVGQTTADADGRYWLRPDQRVVPGLYTLRADHVGEDNTVVARAETPFQRTAPLSGLPDNRRIVVQPGNNLWRLARNIYGQGLQYTVIYQANRTQIRDPDLIYPGQVFVLPAPPEQLPAGLPSRT